MVDHQREKWLFQEVSAQAVCVSTDILQFRTDVKLAIGNTAGWSQSRRRDLLSRVMGMLQNTGEYLIIKVLLADTLIPFICSSLFNVF